MGEYRTNNPDNTRLKIQVKANNIVVGTVGEVHSLIHLHIFDEVFKGMTEEVLTKKAIIDKLIGNLYLDQKMKTLLNLDGDFYEFNFKFFIAKKDKLFYVDETGHVMEIDDVYSIGSNTNSRLVLKNTNYDHPNDLIIEALTVVSKIETGVSGPFYLLDTKKLKHTTLEEGETK